MSRIAPTEPHAGETVEDRVVAAVLRCVARWGLAKTTAEDVAREAGVSRATLYRAFPGGKDSVLDAVLHHELARFLRSVTADLDGCEDLEDLLVTGITAAGRFLDEHRALRFLLDHEPERILPAFAFHRLDRVLALATEMVAPQLGRFLERDLAEELAELAARLVLSLWANPSPAYPLQDPAAIARLVRRHIAPASTSARTPTPHPPSQTLPPRS